jgi:MFS transporter, FSR family, fosmidomycin resistance protein
MAVVARAGARPYALGGASMVGVLAASHAAADIPFSAISALLPSIQARFGLTESLLALFVAALSFAASVTQPVFGALADRVGARLVGAGGVVASSALLALVGVAPSVWVLLGLLLTGGLASAAMHPAFTSVSRRHASSRGGLAVSLYSAGGTLGVAIGPVAVLAVMSTVGQAGTPWLMLPGVILGLVTYLLVPSDRPAERYRPPIIDRALLAGPVGALTVAITLAGVPFIAFGAAVPLWLVSEHGIGREDPLIGWTLSAFALAAAAGAVAGGALVTRVRREIAVPGTMLVALPPLLALLVLEPGSAPFFGAVIASGALLNASLPIAIVTAQDLSPRAVAAASGMLMGLAHGVAGLLYVAVGALQEQIGVGPALAATYAVLPPAAGVAYAVLGRAPRAPTERDPETTRAADCPCPV